MKRLLTYYNQVTANKECARRTTSARAHQQINQSYKTDNNAVGFVLSNPIASQTAPSSFHILGNQEQHERE